MSSIPLVSIVMPCLTSRGTSKPAWTVSAARTIPPGGWRSWWPMAESVDGTPDVWLGWPGKTLASASSTTRSGFKRAA